MDIEEKILKRLREMADRKYKDFYSKLVPNIGEFLGCRVSKLRNFALTLTDKEKMEFISILPHTYYDENMLHAICLGYIKLNVADKLKLIDKFLIFVDNWAVCDSLCSGLFKNFKNVRDKKEVFAHSLKCLRKSETYTIRYGLVIMKINFLDRYSEYIDDIFKIKNNDYYVLMGEAWFLSELLIKYFEEGVEVLKMRKLDKFVFNMAIQKSIDSYRLSLDKKEELKKLKIK